MFRVSCNTICFVLYLAHLSYCANILALVPTTSYSHQIVFAPLWKTLSLRGHNVTVLTTDPQKDPSLTNLTEIDMHWAYKFNANMSHAAEYIATMWNFHGFISHHMGVVCDNMLSSETGQVLFNNGNTFDVVLVENLCPELLGFAEMYNCPKILIATMSLSSILYSYIGDSVHPVSHPEFVTPFTGKLTFRERVVSTIVSWYLYCMFSFVYLPAKDNLLRKYFNTSSTTKELLSDIDMLFLHVNPLIHGPRAIGPSTITIGGYRHDVLLKPLSLDVQRFLDKATEGCVYVSFGGNIKSSQMSQRLLSSIAGALGEIPYKVLWKFDAESSSLPQNIKAVKWLQQQKVLSHPNLKVFVTHGGLQSMEESIYGEVPFVVIPFFVDQSQNARILENRGVAIVLNHKTLTKDELKNAIQKVMNDSKYSVGVKNLKRLIMDEPMTGLEKSVWWTEYVIRNKGAKYLRNPVADLPFYQYYLLDVMGFFLGITVAIIVAVTVTFRKIYYLLLRARYCSKKEKSQ